MQHHFLCNINYVAECTGKNPIRTHDMPCLLDEGAIKDIFFFYSAGGKRSSDINTLIIIGSSVSVFVLSLVFCLGCCCCLTSARYKNKQRAERSSRAASENSGPVPIYDDLAPVSINSKENELNLRENVAYHSVETNWHSNSPA